MFCGGRTCHGAPRNRWQRAGSSNDFRRLRSDAILMKRWRRRSSSSPRGWPLRARSLKGGAVGCRHVCSCQRRRAEHTAAHSTCEVRRPDPLHQAHWVFSASVSHSCGPMGSDSEGGTGSRARALADRHGAQERRVRACAARAVAAPLWLDAVAPSAGPSSSCNWMCGSSAGLAVCYASVVHERAGMTLPHVSPAQWAFAPPARARLAWAGISRRDWAAELWTNSNWSHAPPALARGAPRGGACREWPSCQGPAPTIRVLQRLEGLGLLLAQTAIVAGGRTTVSRA